MIARSEKLRKKPEFYDTFNNSCISNIIDHVHTLHPDLIPYDYRSLFPGYASDIVYEIGLVDTSIPLEILQERYRITQKALDYGYGDNFSSFIRE
jgi:hypothetical protein